MMAVIVQKMVVMMVVIVVNSCGDDVIKVVIVVLLIVEILIVMVINALCDSEDRVLFSQEILFRNTELISIISVLIFNFGMIQNLDHYSNIPSAADIKPHETPGKSEPLL